MRSIASAVKSVSRLRDGPALIVRVGARSAAEAAAVDMVGRHGKKPPQGLLVIGF